MLLHQVRSQPCCIEDMQHSIIPTLLVGFLSKQQKQEFQDCFALLDIDKTGRLSVDNLLGAFQLLNIQVQSDTFKVSCTVTYTVVQQTQAALTDRSAIGHLPVTESLQFDDCSCNTAPNGKNGCHSTCHA